LFRSARLRIGTASLSVFDRNAGRQTVFANGPFRKTVGDREEKPETVDSMQRPSSFPSISRPRRSTSYLTRRVFSPPSARSRHQWLD
jgi:hypothetical protein